MNPDRYYENVIVNRACPFDSFQTDASLWSFELGDSPSHKISGPSKAAESVEMVRICAEVWSCPTRDSDQSCLFRVFVRGQRLVFGRESGILQPPAQFSSQSYRYTMVFHSSDILPNSSDAWPIERHDILYTKRCPFT